MKSSQKSLIIAAALLVLGMMSAKWILIRPTILTGSNKLMTQYESFRAHVENEGSFDVIVFGNSVARQGIEPLQLGARLSERFGKPIRVYNFGTGGMTELTLPYTSDMAYGVDQPSVALLVVGLRIPTARSQGAHERAETQHASPYGQAFADPVEWRGWLKRWLLDHVTAFRVRYSLKSTILGEHITWHKAGVNDGRRGFEYATIVPVDEQRWNLVQKQTGSWSEVEAKKQVLLDAVLHLKRHAPVVWLIQAPVHPRRLSRFDDPEGSWKLFGQLIVDAAAKAHVHALILPDQSTFPAEEFADVHHLNPEAAQRYTAWIGDELELGQWRAQ